VTGLSYILYTTPPGDAMAYIEDRQRLYVVLAVIGQLIILLIMNFTTYQPYS